MPPIYSVRIIICCVILLVGCSQHRRQPSFAAGILQAQSLVSSYGEVANPVCTRYLTELVRRTGGTGARNLSVRILNTDELVALLAGNDQVLISKGLITKLSSEAEAAFILTHEAGHFVLDHSAQLENSPAGFSSSKRRELELEADSYALSQLDLSGYDTSASVSALTTVYSAQHENRQHREYPNIHERIRNLSVQVMTTRNRGTGIRDRRDFQRCRVGL